MRRLAIALSVTMLLVTGCGGDDGADDPTRGSEVTAETAASADENSSTTVATSDTDEDAGDASDADGGDDPAGRTSEEILVDGNWLEDGRVSIGPAAPQEQEVGLAMCNYVVGGPEDVAGAVGVAGALALDPESGFAYYGSSGGSLQCLYVEDGVDAILVAVRVRETEFDEESAHVVAQTLLPSAWYGVVAVNPDWDGQITMDESSAIEWLRDIDTRWGGASV